VPAGQELRTLTAGMLAAAAARDCLSVPRIPRCSHSICNLAAPMGGAIGARQRLGRSPIWASE
jgi:hypothetical protein